MLNLNEKINDFYINITKLGYSSNVNIFFDNNSIAKFLIHTCINNDCDDKLCTYTVYRDYLLKNNIINEFEDEMLTKVFDYKYNILIPEISNIISNIKYHVSIKDINDTLLIIRKNLIEEMLDIESTLLDVVYISSLYSGICFKKLVKLDKIRNNLLYFFT